MADVTVRSGGMRIRTIEDFQRVGDAAAAARLRTLKQAARRIRDDAGQSMARIPGPSLAGQPPHVHEEAELLESLGFIVDDQGAVIGPRDAFVGELGFLHEFGGTFGGATYPPRPFMRPALERNAGFFAGLWDGAIG